MVEYLTKSGAEEDYYRTNPHLRFLIERAFPGDKDAFNAILTSVGEVSAREFAPRAKKNDETGCSLEDCIDGFNKVVLPEGTQKSLETMRKLGLFGATIPGEYKGDKDIEALSHTIHGAMTLMISQAEAALPTIPNLTENAALTLARYAPDKGDSISGLCSDLTAAMLITEPDAGTDVGALVTSAEKVGENYVITGTKSFITNPDADVLIVLARIKGAPKGIRGLSLFLVPKYVDGERNGIKIPRLENKMGIHSSPTAEVQLDGTVGYLIGEEHKGYRVMRDYMYRVRLGVAAQSLGIAQRAFTKSVNYCADRKIGGKKLQDLPLMSQRLVNMSIEIEAATSLVFYAFNCYDNYVKLKAQCDSEGISVPPKDTKLSDFLILLAKVRGSQTAVEQSGEGQDIHGGSGYIREIEMERLCRDAKVTEIYEGTTAAQQLTAVRQMTSVDNFKSLYNGLEQRLTGVEDDLLKPYVSRVKEFKEYIFEEIRKIEGINDKEEKKKKIDLSAPKLTDAAIRLFEATLMLDEAQYLIKENKDYRKAVTAIEYIRHNLSREKSLVAVGTIPVDYFDNIIYHDPLSSLNPEIIGALRPKSTKAN